MNWHHALQYLGFAEQVFPGDRVWGSGEVGCGVWGSGEVGKWGSGEAVSSPYYPKTLSPYLFPDDRLLPTLSSRLILVIVAGSLGI
ncbi:MAG: hypothetical protein EWV55_16865 [Microcystis viridis Mv_BB_P_19951000_S69]|uniref:Uncharacterized protein n=1 Tax=Microcystis viridis Mv_BB_P_19951000_S68D TaxID=2486270 RepID=A0A552H921_MICVR|nr:MAG: hypothetical protein EWV77_21925 [Microcystis viridis Mv_BB_P_19951000_S68D]TRU69047.1 MAG: hypothetical protein EWV47_21585 [Microcystis viridis Mv_BB_P_19951000_S68]TRU71545.1 MAG: hypothetical protein EWV55_16865 [Microcystis viridis Mv_BB_P_19951000_S69]TRU80082.1 MAG: hypothetical protein EWV46_24310 [Microcystis viridis Mv_BB_P_19951000_S69D]